MGKFHDENVNVGFTLLVMAAALDMKTQRLQLCLMDSTRYWVAAVLEEWRDAVLVKLDNDKTVLLMKQTLQSIEPVPRPVASKAAAHDD